VIIRPQPGRTVGRRISGVEQLLPFVAASCREVRIAADDQAFAGMVRLRGVMVNCVMNLYSPATTETLTAPERDLIRREFGQHFSSYPSLAEGIFLRTWRGGPQAGQPKLPPAIQTMIARGLVEVRMDGRTTKAFFTEAGLASLREFARNRRYLDPIGYAHVRRELGLEADENVTGVCSPIPSTDADQSKTD
jgi:hypothetical protein